MPYIPYTERHVLRPTAIPRNAGELNYAITALCVEYMAWVGGNHYSTINDIMGAMECAKQEFYRRVAVPYEDGKKDENGDVY